MKEINNGRKILSLPLLGYLFRKFSTDVDDYNMCMVSKHGASLPVTSDAENSHEESDRPHYLVKGRSSSDHYENILCDLIIFLLY